MTRSARQTGSRVLTSLLAIVVVIVTADQAVKWLVDGVIGPDQTDTSRWLLGDWLGLRYAENSGVAFGLFQGHSSVILLLAAVAVVSLIVWYAYRHRQERWTTLAAGLVIGGALGNMLDRIRLGHVRDFFAVGPWPSFNVADAAVTVGVAIFFLATLLEDHQTKNRDSDASAIVASGPRAAMEKTE